MQPRPEQVPRRWNVWADVMSLSFEKKASVARNNRGENRRGKNGCIVGPRLLKVALGEGDVISGVTPVIYVQYLSAV